MPTINFPSGPSLNDSYNLGTRTWKWNGEAWALQPLTGGFTGSAGASGYTGSAGAGGSSGAIGYTGSTGVVLPLTIDTTNDRVGIGTTSPATSLHIAAQIPKIRIEDTDLSGMAFDIRGAGPAVHFDLDPGSSQALADYMWDIGGSTKMKLRGTGRLGIGTTTPSTTLDVVGDIKSSGKIFTGDTELQSGSKTTISAGTSNLEVNGTANGMRLYVRNGGVEGFAAGSEGGLGHGAIALRGQTILVGGNSSKGFAFGRNVSWSDVNAIGQDDIVIKGDTVNINGALTVGGVAITPVTVPTISSISPATIETSTATAVTITGTNFASIPQVEALNSTTGIWYTADSIAFTNSTTIVATFNLSVNASYKLRVENPDGNAVLSSTALMSVSAAPTFSTSAGSLGSIAGNFSGTVATLAGSSDSTIAFSETTNVLTNSSQANCTLNSSTGVITTTDLGGSSTTPTTYNFTVRITDAESQTVDRSFSLTSSYGATGGGQFN